MQKRIILLSGLKTEATNLLCMYRVSQDWQDTAQDLLDQLGYDLCDDRLNDVSGSTNSIRH